MFGFLLGHDFQLECRRTLGCTGSMAATLHQRVLDHFDDYFPMAGYRRMFEALQHPGTPTQVASRVLKILNKLWDDRAVSREK
jgi:hypothetical protein